MIRVWHGWTTPELADAYEALLFGQVTPGIRAKNIPGFLSIRVMRRRQAETAGEVEFVAIAALRNARPRDQRRTYRLSALGPTSAP